MIAFVQPFGMMDGLGGSRILRALLGDAPESYISICTQPRKPPELGNKEIHLPYRPYLGRIERSRLNQHAWHLLSQFEDSFGQRFERRLEAVIRERGVSAIHAIPQAPDFWWTFRVAQRMDLPYYLSVHDEPHYGLENKDKVDQVLEWLGHVWVHANGRTVISDAMGEEYSRRYGAQDYEVITDGLPTPLRAHPCSRSGQSCRMYFVGSMHLTYRPNVAALEEALFRLQETGGFDAVSMVIRGGGMPVKHPRFAVDERPFAPEDVVLQDLDDVDVLYFPLPFGGENAPFRRFSMSTKLVTYLGSGLPILYHGPADAAASRLLERYDAAAQVHSLEAHALSEGIEAALRRSHELSSNALRLGQDHFRLHDQQERFWKLVTQHQSLEV